MGEITKIKIRGNMVNLVPMAGEGKRFSDAGYTVPKPLISVSGKPMIARAVSGMPKSNEWIFVCRKEHIGKYGMDKILKSEVQQCKILAVADTTSGQLSSCLLARGLLPKNNELFIGACDNVCTWDGKKWQKILDDKSIDAAVWTFTKQMNLQTDPNAWGWVDADANGMIKRISVKQPLTATPFNDHAVVGSFWFRSAETFMDAADELISRNLRVNNEFYVDSIPNILVEKGMKVAIFEVDFYAGFGTPQDLKTYEYWERYFARAKTQQ